VKKNNYFVILASVILLSACNSSKIFFASFDSEADGSRPAASAPGQPAGDTIYSSNSCDLTAGDLVVINSEEFGSKALRYSNVDIAQPCRILNFISRELNMVETKELWFYFNAVPHLSEDSSPLRITATGYNWKPFAGILLQNGKILLQVTAGANPDYELIGSFANGQRQFILFHINQESVTYTLTILKPGGNIELADRPILDPTAFSTSKVSILANYSQIESSDGSYIFDNVTISEKEPEEE
jgi:hypothetical protein